QARRKAAEASSCSATGSAGGSSSRTQNHQAPVAAATPRRRPARPASTSAFRARIRPTVPPGGHRGSARGRLGGTPRPPTTRGEMGFHHVALATTDLAATDRFYREAMGFELVRVDVIPTEGG